MKIVSRLILSVLCVALASPAFADKDPKKGAIKARQGEMQIRKFNMGPLMAMAKGKMPYDAKKAQTMANNLKVLLELNNSAAWMQGTSNKEYPDDTTALPKIWETWPKIADYGKDYAKAVKEVAAVAGNGQSALGKAMKDLGKACKSCHDDFRKKDD
ncbi:MAG: cytochrome c [Gammaproteobacteria bacterium]|nr:cytochrome c [Gammaproteobacteria bacterium]MDH5801531.1 cytochrome c [Gammaproteobacteria bacterium]